MEVTTLAPSQNSREPQPMILGVYLSGASTALPPRDWNYRVLCFQFNCSKNKLYLVQSHVSRLSTKWKSPVKSPSAPFNQATSCPSVHGQRKLDRALSNLNIKIARLSRRPCNTSVLLRCPARLIRRRHILHTFLRKLGTYALDQASWTPQVMENERWDEVLSVGTPPHCSGGIGEQGALG